MNPIVVYVWAELRGRFFQEVRGRSPEMCRWADVPFPASSKAEAAEACYEKIGDKTIRGPWRFEFDAPIP